MYSTYFFLLLKMKQMKKPVLRVRKKMDQGTKLVRQLCLKEI